MREFRIYIKVDLLIITFLGETYSVEVGWQGENSCAPLEDYVGEWIGLGAKFVGGCCRTDAKVIKNIKQQVERFR